MTPEQFCYWLQGRVELLPDQMPSEAEWVAIREHLALTFKKVTPQIGALSGYATSAVGVAQCKPVDPRAIMQC